MRGRFLQRVREVLAVSTKEHKRQTDDPMSFDDLLAAYYFRTLQTSQMIHVCKLGYCRASWSARCKLHLPWEEVVQVMHHDDDSGRMAPRRGNLADDAWVKVHSLPILVRSLMNVQINQHHPDDCGRGLSYSVKYGLKSEPQTRIRVSEETDDSALKFLRGQFVSIVVGCGCGDPWRSNYQLHAQ